jgi:predicted unusual protein kinase regulating ubiquinone biosynthesis (AarF/ABC1/UbiB family)
MNEIIKNIQIYAKHFYFFVCVICVLFTELVKYKCIPKYKYETFIDNITHKLCQLNILYVKIFQAFALNNNIIDENTNNRLMKFTDNAPWSSEDVDKVTLLYLEKEYDIYFKDGYVPMNSGMISLVFKAVKNRNINEHIIVKIKRKNIDLQLTDAINGLQFFINILSHIPFSNNLLQKYQISQIIEKNIHCIKVQTDFQKEIQNMQIMKENCKYLKYVKIPAVLYDTSAKFPNVIIMEYINGAPISKIPKEDYESYAKQVMKFGLVTTLVHSVTHGDLHAGNILFIKDENDKKYPHKIGILDFGITYEIDMTFKQRLFEILTEMNTIPPDNLSVLLLHSGVIEPLDVLEHMPKQHYITIVQLLTDIVSDTLHISKKVNQVKIYHFLQTFNHYIHANDLTNLGLRPSDNFVKLQLALAMAHGVTLTLCGDKCMDLADNVINELFHTNILT